jgi:hypothetical protein
VILNITGILKYTESQIIATERVLPVGVPPAIRRRIRTGDDYRSARVAASAGREVAATPAFDYEVAMATVAAPRRGSHGRLLKASPRTTEDADAQGSSQAVRYRLHEPTVHFERQTQFGDIPWTRE